MQKIHRGKLHNWQVHTLTFDKEMVDNIYPAMKDVEVYQVISGTITDDTTGKRNDYDHCRTSFVINIDRENSKLETLSSIYDLGLEGNDVLPKDMGNAIMNVFY